MTNLSNVILNVPTTTLDLVMLLKYIPVEYHFNVVNLRNRFPDLDFTTFVRTVVCSYYYDYLMDMQVSDGKQAYRLEDLINKYNFQQHASIWLINSEVRVLTTVMTDTWYDPVYICTSAEVFEHAAVRLEYLFKHKQTPVFNEISAFFQPNVVIPQLVTAMFAS